MTIQSDTLNHIKSLITKQAKDELTELTQKFNDLKEASIISEAHNVTITAERDELYDKVKQRAMDDEIPANSRFTSITEATEAYDEKCQELGVVEEIRDGLVASNDIYKKTCTRLNQSLDELNVEQRSLLDIVRDFEEYKQDGKTKLNESLEVVKVLDTQNRELRVQYENLDETNTSIELDLAESRHHCSTLEISVKALATALDIIKEYE